MVIWHDFLQPFAEFHKFKLFSLIFSFNVACSAIFSQYPNLHNSYVNCFTDSFNCKLDAWWNIALNLAYEMSKTYALTAREIPC